MLQKIRRMKTLHQTETVGWYIILSSDVWRDIICFTIYIVRISYKSYLMIHGRIRMHFSYLLNVAYKIALFFIKRNNYYIIRFTNEILSKWNSCLIRSRDNRNVVKHLIAINIYRIFRKLLKSERQELNETKRWKLQMFNRN